MKLKQNYLGRSKVGIVFFCLMMTILLIQEVNAHDTFTHPGIYSTKAQLDFVKQKIEQGEEPWKSAFNKLLESDPTSREPNPRVIVPGSNDPNERSEMDNMTLDGSHAYASALLFYFTGDKKYADYSIEVLNAWRIYEGGGMYLYTTWAASHFINAAELMKHTPGSGWKEADIKTFSTMVNKYMWPRVQAPGVDYGSNHGATANEAQFAIAVFLDDQEKFDTAIENYKWLLPRYVFMNTPNRLDGECNETCRDISHTRLGLQGIMYAANTAWNQGVDLWKDDIDRFAAFAELHAGMMTGETPVPEDICAWKEDQAGIVFCRGNVPWGNPSGQPPCNETAWEILYNHISTRLGEPLPFTEMMTERNRPLGEISRRAIKWETLLHANIDPANIGSFTQATNTALVRPPAGRLAVVADGNSPDPDDIAALAVMFGILKGADVRERLVHLSHSCDLDPFSNPNSNQSIDAANELRRQKKLHAVCEEGIGFFGPFNNLADFYNCRTQQTAAVTDLRDAINASSEDDPLWIIVAGEPDIIGYALEAATASKRQFVHVVSHHPANDNSGDFFTWQQILDFGVNEHQIGDQNVGLQVPIRSGLWDWAYQHPKPGIAWIWYQLKYVEQDNVVGFQKNKFDCSDAGMVYWWITGADNGGNNHSTPVEIRTMLLAGDTENPVAH